MARALDGVVLHRTHKATLMRTDRSEGLELTLAGLGHHNGRIGDDDSAPNSDCRRCCQHLPAT